MIVELSAFTNEGRVRTNNEDSWDIIAASWKAQNKTITVTGNGVLLAVADGMGGTNAGEVASRIAVETFRKEFEGLTNPENDDNSRLLLLEGLIKKAHKNIVAESTRNLDHAGMGTTAVLAWLIDDKAFVTWCGDSRLYLYRLGKPFAPFTDDHSMVWEQVVKGNMNAEQARLSDESNIILQSLGDIKQPPKPESRVLALQQNDRLLLCSDGLNSMLSDGEIQSLLATPNFDTTLVSRELVKAANSAGGQDNTTVIVANVVQGQKVASSPYPANEKKGLSKLNLALLSLCLVLAAGVGYYYYVGISKPKFLAFSPTEVYLISKLNSTFGAFATEKENFLKDKQDLSVCNLEEPLKNLDSKSSDFRFEIKKYGLKISNDKRSILIDSTIIHIRDTLNSKAFDEANNNLGNIKVQLDNIIKKYQICIQPKIKPQREKAKLPKNERKVKEEPSEKISIKVENDAKHKFLIKIENDAIHNLERLKTLRWEKVGHPKYTNGLTAVEKKKIDALNMDTKSKIIKVYGSFGFKVSEELKYQGCSPNVSPIPNSSIKEIEDFINNANKKIITSNN